MPEKYLCPSCGEPLEEDERECAECGWKPITKEEVQGAVFGYLDEIVAEGGSPDDVSIAQITTYLGLEEVPKHLISSCRRKYKETMQKPNPQPQMQTQYQPQPLPQYQPIPDWMLAPYKMQIDHFKDERDKLQRRVEDLEKQLREAIQRPTQVDSKWQELDKLAFERLKEDITTGRNSNSPPKSWMEELVSGLVNSGQLGNIATEAASLLSDLRNRGNPNHDPYAEFYAQKQAQMQAQGEMVRRQTAARRRPVPPSNIKRRQTQQAPRPQPQPQPKQQSQPTQEADFTEVEREYNPQTEEVEIELTPENAEIYQQFITKYPDLADTVPTILVAIDQEQPNISKPEKIRLVIETLRVVAQLREIGVGVKGVLSGTFTPEYAASYLIRRYPEQAKILAQDGPDAWLERGNIFIDHPIHGKDIRFLQEPEVREVIDKIVVEIKKRFRME